MSKFTPIGSNKFVDHFNYEVSSVNGLTEPRLRASANLRNFLFKLGIKSARTFATVTFTSMYMGIWPSAQQVVIKNITP